MGDHACRLLWSRHRKGTHHFRLHSTDQSPSTMLPPPLLPPPPLCHICWTQSVPGHSPCRHLLPSIHLTLWMDSHKQCLPWIKQKHQRTLQRWEKYKHATVQVQFEISPYKRQCLITLPTSGRLIWKQGSRERPEARDKRKCMTAVQGAEQMEKTENHT